MTLNSRVDGLLDKMTLEEKASLCSGDGYWFTKAVERVGIERIMLTDGPHGLRRQVGNADHLGLNKSVESTCFPAGATVANSWDVELFGKMASLMAIEADSEGVDVVLGPAINIKRSPLCGRNFEYLSEEPYLAGKMAAAYINAMQKNGISACPKHFAVNNQETLRMVVDAVVDERTLREIYLLPFEYAVKEGNPDTIMSSYNQVNGTYANENSYLLDKILTKEWGFNGVVMSDWGGSNDRVEALKAGSHLEMPTTMGETDREIVEAVKSGDISEDLLDQRLRPLLRLILQAKSRERINHDYPKELHHKHAAEIASQSMVLLKNQNSILPLNEKNSIAIIGDFADQPRYQGAGSSIINPTKLESPLKVLQESELNVIGYAPGFKRLGGTSKRLKKQAIELAEKAHTVLLFLGLDESTEAEGLDRENMDISINQRELIEAVARVNSNIVVVLSGGAPVNTKWDVFAHGLLHAYLGGQAGAIAIRDILTGKVNPSGKLTETYAENYSDIASSTYYPGAPKTAEHREGIYVGYRYFDKSGVEPKYPFGFGLSYTTFEYSDLRVDRDRIKCRVRNSGDREGKEIVQCYISASNSAVFRPVKELKAFTKVTLLPGEEKEVELTLDDKAFAYYNVNKECWYTEKGEYKILIGSSSKDIRLEENISIDGSEGDNPYKTMDLNSYESGKVDSVTAKEFQKLLGRVLPEREWNKEAEITVNSPIMEGKHHRGVAKFIYNFISLSRFFVRNDIKKRTAVEVSLHMPYRALSRMTNGMLSWSMLQALLTMINRGFWKGIIPFIKAWTKKGRR